MVTIGSRSFVSAASSGSKSARAPRKQWPRMAGTVAKESAVRSARLAEWKRVRERTWDPTGSSLKLLSDQSAEMLALPPWFLASEDEAEHWLQRTATAGSDISIGGDFGLLSPSVSGSSFSLMAAPPSQ